MGNELQSIILSRRFITLESVEPIAYVSYFSSVVDEGDTFFSSRGHKVPGIGGYQLLVEDS